MRDILPCKQPLQTLAHRLDKARALLLSLIAEHEYSNSRRKCRSCLAREEFDSPHACKIVAEFIAAFDSAQTSQVKLDSVRYDVAVLLHAYDSDNRPGSLSLGRLRAFVNENLQAQIKTFDEITADSGGQS